MIINDVYIPYLKDSSSWLILYGGSGSGKSRFAAQKIYQRITTEEDHRIVAIRKVETTLHDSIYSEIKKVIASEGTEHEFTCTIKPLAIKHNPTGNEILFKGLDDAEKIKSISEISSIWVEEATELEQSDIEQLEIRLRGKRKSYKQIILSFNPISENHWIKQYFFDQEVKNCSILKTTYLDNYWLDDQDREKIERKKKTNENFFRIYGLGEWGREDTGNNFYKSFSYSRQVSELSYNEELPLHISWDFNINPSCSVTVWQTLGNQLFCIDEIQLDYPNNSTRDICREFKARYYDHRNGLFIYGDPAGRHGDTRSERGHNDYTIIQNELTKYHPVLRVALKAPGVSIRGQFINAVFDLEFDNVRILIDPKNKKFIEDLNYIKQNSDGTKLKEKYKNKSGIVCEKYGHLSDTLDYFICEYLAMHFNQFQRGTTFVKPRHGRNLINAKHRF